MESKNKIKPLKIPKSENRIRVNWCGVPKDFDRLEETKALFGPNPIYTKGYLNNNQIRFFNV